MATLSEKKDDLRRLDSACNLHSEWLTAREALRREIAREEEEERGKLPTLALLQRLYGDSIGTLPWSTGLEDKDFRDDLYRHAREVLQAVEKLAPHLKNGGKEGISEPLPWFRDFADAIAAIVRL